VEDSNAGFQKKIETGWLLAFYGPLLTERQQELMRLHFEEDQSLGEIAQQEGVSRQGVHDILHRATEQLYQLEEKLGMFKRFQRMQTGLEDVLDCLNGVQKAEGQEQLAAAKKIIAELLKEDEE
jgi:predicted DNA-binding protein YlxM (UPF0122 family)